MCATPHSHKIGEYMKKLKIANPELVNLINVLKNKKEKIWKDVALRLSKKRTVVNIAKISRHAKDNEIILVPGKVLGYGKLDKKVTVAALSFSKEAEKKIKGAKGKCKKINDILNENQKNIRIFG